MDPCPSVRVIAVQGICRIANLFWELIPIHTLQAFMTKLVQEVVFDASSSSVRAAVFQVGITLTPPRDKVFSWQMTIFCELISGTPCRSLW